MYSVTEVTRFFLHLIDRPLKRPIDQMLRFVFWLGGLRPTRPPPAWEPYRRRTFMNFHKNQDFSKKIDNFDVKFNDDHTKLNKTN